MTSPIDPNGHRRPHDDSGAEPPPRGDRLDEILRAWHDEHRDAAEAMRGRVLDAARSGRASSASRVAGRIGFAKFLATAALLAISAVLATLVFRGPEQQAFALGGIAQVAEGGALDALDAEGNVLGPCPLQRTDVRVEISGIFVRTYVEQTYANPYARTIEAVYAFPLPHGAAVDRMTMVVRGPGGEKTVEGEVKERAIARAIYEEARESGYVASLLEQERPNVFTQSVANVEPGASVRIRIATIEVARRRDGVAEYVFPLVVGPRYVPGAPASTTSLPEGWRVREGVVLRAPAAVEIGAGSGLAPARMLALLERAVPVAPVAPERVDRLIEAGGLVAFTSRYGNGSAERGTYSPTTGLGELNGRFFFAPLGTDSGTGFATDTDVVPDASRITPMPVPPSERAGHDVSISVALDSGGPEIASVESELHAIRTTSPGPGVRRIELESGRTIPNRDFILRWRVADGSIEPAFFTYRSDSADPSVAGGYFALLVEPPARVTPAELRPRELVFVLDVSGSMNGFPIEKSKALVRKALAAMRPNDVFNVITFAGATSILWPEPRPATEENRRLADAFVDGAHGSGGTEMMAAIEAALVQEGRSGLAPARLLDLPADGRRVRVVVAHDALSAGGNGMGASIDAGRAADGSPRRIALALPVALPSNPGKLAVILDGAWETRDGERVLVARSARFEDADARTRIVVFLTDGYIGNDQGVIAAVRDNARASRVFSFGIGNSVNRFLLEEMARAGRGTCEIVTLAEEADPVVERLARRIDAPVLTDLELDVPAELALRDLHPAPEHLPDLFDEEPVLILGRYDAGGRGTITLRGRTAAGPWERSIEVDLPNAAGGADVVPTLWARAAVDALLLPKLAQVESQTLDLPTKQAVIRLGERYRIATPYTSFVAVEKSRVVVGGRPLLVGVPVELPEGTNWNGFFGEGARPAELVVANAGRDPRVADLAARIESRLMERGLVERGLVERRIAGSERGVDPADASMAASGQLFFAASAPVAAAMPRMTSGGQGGGAGGGAGGGLGGGGGGSASVQNAQAPASAAPPRAAGQPSVSPPGSGRERFQFGAPTASEPAGGVAAGVAGGSRVGVQAKGSAPVAAKPAGPGGRARRAAGGAEAAQGAADAARAATETLERRMRDGAAARPGLSVALDEQSVGGVVETESGSGDRSGVEAAKRSAGEAASGSDAIDDPGFRDRLVRIIERRLALVAVAALLGDANDASTLVAAFGFERTDGRLALIARVAPGAADRVAAELRTRGMTVDAIEPARDVVLLHATPAQLADLARIADVRRVEPLVTSPMPAAEAR